MCARRFVRSDHLAKHMGRCSHNNARKAREPRRREREVEVEASLLVDEDSTMSWSAEALCKEVPQAVVD